MNIIDPDVSEDEDAVARQRPSWVVNHENRMRESSVPTVTQMTQEDTYNSSSASSCSQFVSPPFKKNSLPTPTKKKVPTSSTRSSCWFSKLGKGTKMKGEFKLKKMSKTITQVQIGSIVKKKLRVFAEKAEKGHSNNYSSKFFQKAMVFGTVKQKLKKGRWLIYFDNQMKLNLKCDEFVLVCYNPDQKVITRDKNNNMIMKPPVYHFFDELNAEQHGLTHKDDTTNESETAIM